MKMTSALMAVGALALVPLIGGPAAAAPLGLKQLEGPEGCIVDETVAATLPDCLTGRALLGARASTASPDGRHVYVVAANSSSIAVFRRAFGDGALRQLGGEAGCIVDRTAPPVDGCATGRALEGAFNVTVSPDGRNVYVAAEGGNGIAVFRRHPWSGALTQPAGTAGCIVDPANTTDTDCAVGRALQQPRGVVATWRFVYVAAGGSGAVAAFKRGPVSGALSQIAGPGGCIVDQDADAIDDCATGRALTRPRDLALIGASLYVPSDHNDGVAALGATAGAARSARTPTTAAASSMPARRSPAAPRAARSTTRVAWRRAATAAASTSPPATAKVLRPLSATARAAGSPRSTARPAASSTRARRCWTALPAARCCSRRRSR